MGLLKHRAHQDCWMHRYRSLPTNEHRDEMSPVVWIWGTSPCLGLPRCECGVINQWSVVTGVRRVAHAPACPRSASTSALCHDEQPLMTAPAQFRSGPQRIVHEMGIPRRSSRLSVSQQPADDRQGQAEARQDRGVRVPEVMDPDAPWVARPYPPLPSLRTPFLFLLPRYQPCDTPRPKSA